MKKRILTAILLLALALPLWPQSARDDLNSALQLYERKRYSEAAELALKGYRAVEEEVNPYASSQLFLLIRSYYHLGRYRDGLELAVHFMDSFEFSRYTDQVLYFRALMLIELGSYTEAHISALEALDFSDSAMEMTIKDLALNLSRYYLSDNQVIAASGFHRKEEFTVFSRLMLADRQLKRGEAGPAEQILRSQRTAIKRRYDILLYNELVKELRSISRRQSITLGVVLPLSGEQAGSGTAILQGLKFAVEHYKRILNYNIHLLVFDNRGELIQSVHAARKLADMPDVAAIIGPLNSRNAVAMASVCELHNIPLLAPTATIQELSQLGRNVFQFNTNQEERSSALAEFAMDSLGLKTFATLAPSDDYGIVSTEGFIETVESKGGEVIYMGWYSGSPEDLNLQFGEMRDIAFNILESDTMDTNNVLLDSTLVLKTASDSMKIRLRTVDGIYLPSYREHIEFVTSHLAWWNFDLQILGDGSFYDLELLEKLNRYVNGVIFSNNYYIDDRDPEYVALANRFRQMSGEEMGMLHIYGFEMISFLVNAGQNRAFSRNDLVRRLERVVAYRGLVRNFQFDPGRSRANHGIRIIQYKSGNLKVLN